MNRVFVILDLFLPFDPPNNPKNQNFEKSKKCLEILSFYTSVPQMTIIWCMLPEIWSMTVIIFCHFGPFFAFYLINNPKNQNFEKMKKMDRDLIVLDKCTENHDHMLYCSRDMGCNRCEKNTWRYHQFIHAYQKLRSNDVHFLGYSVQWTDE